MNEPHTEPDEDVYPNDEDSLEGMFLKWGTAIRAKYRKFGRLGRTRQFLWLGAMTLLVPGVLLMLIGTFFEPWVISTGKPLAAILHPLQLGLILGLPVGVALGETVAFRPGKVPTVIAVLLTALMTLWILNEASGSRADAAALLFTGAALVLAASIVNAISAWLPKPTH